MNLKVIYTQEYLEEAERWANQLSIPLSCASAENAKETEELHLKVDGNGLALAQRNLELRGDFTRMLPRLRPSNLNREFLVKAGRIKNITSPVALDATAGLGEDSLLLAAAGFRVHLFEYNPVIGALLQDSMERGMENPELGEIISRMTLYIADSIQALRNPEESIGCVPDLVLLDPMFPERQKSALVKKKFQLLQQLESPCMEEEELLQASLESRTGKILIKRPLKGPYLAGKKPSYSISGKAIRYDSIIIPR